ncbi:MAG: PIN domain-containing protein [Nitrospirota bacterium]
MSLRDEWIVLDTNIWIFGLRRHPDAPACSSLLDRLSQLRVVLPRQIVRELQANLTESELRSLFHLLEQFPDRIKIEWGKAQIKTIQRYERLGCRRGDAAVAAHLEELGIHMLVTENRNFLKGIKECPFRQQTAADALADL